MRVVNRRSGDVLGDRILRAETFFDRTRGLLGRASLDTGEGLWIEPCSSIHMFGMRFAIDAVFVDADHRVTRVVGALPPWRAAFGGRGSRAVLELPVGCAASTHAGDVLDLAP
jgi:uncharacterized protein